MRSPCSVAADEAFSKTYTLSAKTSDKQDKGPNGEDDIIVDIEKSERGDESGMQ